MACNPVKLLYVHIQDYCHFEWWLLLLMFVNGRENPVPSPRPPNYNNEAFITPNTTVYIRSYSTFPPVTSCNRHSDWDIVAADRDTKENTVLRAGSLHNDLLSSMNKTY